MSYSYALSVFMYYYYTKHGKLYFISVSVSWEWKLHSLYVQKCFLGCLVWVSSVFWMTYLLLLPGWQQIGTSDRRASYDRLGTLW